MFLFILVIMTYLFGVILKNTFYLIILFTAFLSSALLYSKEPLLAIKQGDLWHFVDYEGKDVFTPLRLTNVFSKSDGMIAAQAVIDNKNVIIYIDINGKPAVAANTHIPFHFKEGKLRTVLLLDSSGDKRLYGFVNKDNTEFFPNSLSDALDFTEGLAYIKDNKNQGYIDTNKRWVIKLDSLVGDPFSEGLAAVSSISLMKFGFINKTGKLVIPLIYDEAGRFKEGLARVYGTHGFGYIDTSGFWRIISQFDDARDFSEKRTFVGKYNEERIPIWGVYDNFGNKTVDFIFTKSYDYSDSLAAVQKNNQNWGFIDLNGKTVIDFDYQQVGSFVGGKAFVVRYSDGKAGFINKKGEFIKEYSNFDILIDLRTNARFASYDFLKTIKPAAK